jgi:hypothetical protein
MKKSPRLKEATVRAHTESVTMLVWNHALSELRRPFTPTLSILFQHRDFLGLSLIREVILTTKASPALVAPQALPQ